MSKNIIVDLLEKLNPTLDTMVDNIFKDENAKRVKDGSKTKIYSEYDRKLEKLCLMHDIVKSFSTYTKPTDVLGEFSVKGSNKGTLQIDAKISRDGDSNYFLETRLVYAGGHNIQRLHYRVITSSNLPKDGDKTMLNGLAYQIKKMTTIERLEGDIKMNERFVERYVNELKEIENLTSEEVLQKTYKKMNGSLYSYDELKKDYQYYVKGFLVFDYKVNTKEDWEKIIKSDKKLFIIKHNATIKRLSNDIKRLNETIEKIKTKISEL